MTKIWDEQLIVFMFGIMELDVEKMDRINMTSNENGNMNKCANCVFIAVDYVTYRNCSKNNNGIIFITAY